MSRISSHNPLIDKYYDAVINALANLGEWAELTSQPKVALVETPPANPITEARQFLRTLSGQRSIDTRRHARHALSVLTRLDSSDLARVFEKMQKFMPGYAEHFAPDRLPIVDRPRKPINLADHLFPKNNRWHPIFDQMGQDGILKTYVDHLKIFIVQQGLRDFLSSDAALERDDFMNLRRLLPFVGWDDPTSLTYMGLDHFLKMMWRHVDHRVHMSSMTDHFIILSCPPGPKYRGGDDLLVRADLFLSSPDHLSAGLSVLAERTREQYDYMKGLQILVSGDETQAQLVRDQKEILEARMTQIFPVKPEHLGFVDFNVVALGAPLSVGSVLAPNNLLNFPRPMGVLR